MFRKYHKRYLQNVIHLSGFAANFSIFVKDFYTNFEKVTAPVEYGGLGFDYKWDLGWMNDTLDYFKKAPEERKSNLGKLTSR